MIIIGCEFHRSFQRIAYVNQETAEYGERRLNHREEAAGFYGSLVGRKVVEGLEATGNDRWFRKLVAESGHGAQSRCPHEWGTRRFTELQRQDARLIEWLARPLK